MTRPPGAVVGKVSDESPKLALRFVPVVAISSFVPDIKILWQKKPARAHFGGDDKSDWPSLPRHSWVN